MIRCKREKVQWLEFEQLQEFDEIVHRVFLRHGQMEAGRITSEMLGVDQLVSCRQVHGTHLEALPSSAKALETGCDGLMTNEIGIGLMIRHADCQATIFFDPVKKVIANVHCGWRGNVQNIYAKTVNELKEKFGCSPSDLLVCISPSLGPENAEFTNFKEELPKAFWSYQVRPCYFNFWEIAKEQLLSAKILENHIEIAEICTMREEKDFFSYRRDKKTGRHGTVVSLREV